MKIYYASQSFYPHIGGVSTYLLNLAKEMKKNGNEVVEVHLRSAEEDYEDEIRGIEIHRVPREPIDFEIMKGYSLFKETVYKECHYNMKEFDKSPDKIEGFEEYNKVNEYFGEELRELLKQQPADIVHIHDFQLLFTYKYVPRGIPCILTWHIPFIKNMSKYLAKFLIKHLKEYDKVVFSSQDYIEAAVKFGLPREKTELIYPIANTNLFKKMDINKAVVKQKYKIPANSRIILSVQRVDPKSGHEQLIKAMPKIIKEVPNAKLVFVGGDSMSNKFSKSRQVLKQKVLKLIKDLNLESDVIWTGTIDYHVLPELYNSADVIALCSKNEGFGLAITEGMACGKPVVGTKVGGIPIQIKDGENGFLVDVGDIKATARSIVKIIKGDTSIFKFLRGESLSEKMSKKSLELVDKNFKIENGVERHLMLYNSIKRIKDEFHRIEYLDLSDIRAIVVDLDRTITDKPCKRRFDPADFDSKLLNELKSLNVPLFLATGKSIGFVKDMCKKFKCWAGVVAENGAVLYFPLTKKTIVINTEHMRKARETIRALKLPRTALGEVIMSVHVNDEVLVKRKLGKLAKNLNFVKNVDEAMVLPTGVDKGLGVRLMMRYLDIDLEKIVLIGDGENDEDMFLNPGFKIALANATKKLKRLANQVTAKPATEGVREVLKKLKP